MKYVAFLRGVNVGGRNIKMADVKACFELAGFTDVKTVLQSGNIIFESDKKAYVLKEQIERLLTKNFKYPAKAHVVQFKNLESVVKTNPFGASPANYHQYVIFMDNELEAKLLVEAGTALGEQVQEGSGVIYWTVEKGMTLDSPFAKLLNKSAYKDFNTNRNINTLNKILAA